MNIEHKAVQNNARHLRLGEILKCLDDFELSSSGVTKNLDIKSLHHDSRTVTTGGLFFVISGTKVDGVKFVKQAVRAGAVCVVSEKILPVRLPQIIVPNVRAAMSLIAKVFYGNVVDKLKIVAVVGTNGKTTVSHMLGHVLEQGKSRGKVGIIGTLGVRYGNSSSALKAGMTTPDPIELHRIFSEMYARGVKTVVMEASAHAIHFRKLDGINFEAAIFTNISRDHLDFFPSFENYCNTKINFFLENNNIKTVIVNVDNDFGKRIIEKRVGKTVAYSLEDISLQMFPDKSTFVLDGQEITVNMLAKFNVHNALACFYCARELGIGQVQIIDALGSLPSISGRFNTFHITGGVTVIVDYAHTPDGLEKIITAAREMTQGCLITVFGCGGNRDKTKRPIMGQIAVNSSDFSVVTTDNPRDEKPLTIIRQIERGIKQALNGIPKKEHCQKYIIIEDRKESIHYALSKAKLGDIVIIAGKGGEIYTEIKGQRIEYSDEKVILEYESTRLAQTKTEA